MACHNAITENVSQILSELIKDRFDYYKFGIYFGLEKVLLQSILLNNLNRLWYASKRMAGVAYKMKSNHWDFIKSLLGLLQSSNQLPEYTRYVENRIALRSKRFFPTEIRQEHLLPLLGRKSPPDFSVRRLILIAIIHLIEVSHKIPGLCEKVCQDLVPWQKYKQYTSDCSETTGDMRNNPLSEKLLMFDIFSDLIIQKGILQGCQIIKEAYAKIVSPQMYNIWVRVLLRDIMGKNFCDLTEELVMRNLTMTQLDSIRGQSPNLQSLSRRNLCLSYFSGPVP